MSETPTKSIFRARQRIARAQEVLSVCSHSLTASLAHGSLSHFPIFGRPPTARSPEVSLFPMEKGSPIKSPMGTPGVTVYASVWDGRSRKYKNVLFEVTLFILMMELAERLSYYGINQGLKNFMMKIGWSSVSTSALKSTWTSICYMSPIFGAYLVDERWGR